MNELWTAKSRLHDITGCLNVCLHDADEQPVVSCKRGLRTGLLDRILRLQIMTLAVIQLQITNQHCRRADSVTIVMVALCNRADHYIFAL